MRIALLFLLAWTAKWVHAADASWQAYLGGAGSEQYSSLTQINKSNVKQLEVVWSYPTGEKGDYLFNPTVIDGVMYVLAKNNSIVALDAVTGQERWTHSNTGAVTQRGINY
jgi:quinoprotein glucose dehydrogenase